MSRYFGSRQDFVDRYEFHLNLHDWTVELDPHTLGINLFDPSGGVRVITYDELRDYNVDELDRKIRLMLRGFYAIQW